MLDLAACPTIANITQYYQIILQAAYLPVPK
jgi:hypothetical protein